MGAWPLSQLQWGKPSNSSIVDQLPTEAQEAFMLGDDSKWEKARQEAEHLVGEEPIELVLYKGRYERI